MMYLIIEKTATKKFLLEQFIATDYESDWFVVPKNALENLSADKERQKTAGVDNSIREITAHLNYYSFVYLKRFKGLDCVFPTGDNERIFVAGRLF